MNNNTKDDFDKEREHFNTLGQLAEAHGDYNVLPLKEPDYRRYRENARELARL